MAPERNAGSEPAGAPEAGRHLTILFVEDEVLVRFATADLLRSHGYEVVEAADGAEALSLIDAGIEFDLMVSDVRMPGPINGLVLVKELSSRRPHTPVLLATSHWPDGGVANAHFLPKPYGEAALLKAVQTIVRR